MVIVCGGGVDMRILEDFVHPKCHRKRRIGICGDCNTYGATRTVHIESEKTGHNLSNLSSVSRWKTSTHNLYFRYEVLINEGTTNSATSSARPWEKHKLLKIYHTNFQCHRTCMSACMRAYVPLPEGLYVEKLKSSQLIILTKINYPPLCVLVFSKGITSYTKSH